MDTVRIGFISVGYIFLDQRGIQSGPDLFQLATFFGSMVDTVRTGFISVGGTFLDRRGIVRTGFISVADIFLDKRGIQSGPDLFQLAVLFL